MKKNSQKIANKPTKSMKNIRTVGARTTFLLSKIHTKFFLCLKQKKPAHFNMAIRYSKCNLDRSNPF